MNVKTFDVNLNVKYDERFDYNNMDQKPNGRCIIFNHKVFASAGMRERKGTDEDANALKCLFKNMGLTVRQYNNFTATGINKTLREGEYKFKGHANYLVQLN